MTPTTHTLADGRRAFAAIFELIPDLTAEVHRWGATDDGVLIDFTLSGTVARHADLLGRGRPLRDRRGRPRHRARLLLRRPAGGGAAPPARLARVRAQPPAALSAERPYAAGFPAQAAEPAEVAVAAAEDQAVLDRQCGEVRIGHEAVRALLVQQLAKDPGVLRGGGRHPRPRQLEPGLDLRAPSCSEAASNSLGLETIRMNASRLGQGRPTREEPFRRSSSERLASPCWAVSGALA